MLNISDSNVYEYYSKFKQNVPVKDRRVFIKVYRDCFVGKEAVAVLRDLFNITKDQAEELGNKVVI